MMFALGCGGSNATPEPTVAGPVAKFKFGLERLERALRFQPSSANGIQVTKRNLDHEIFPPDDAHANYRARVTIVMESVYLHGKRSAKEDEESEEKAKESEIDDPLADKSVELTKLLEFPRAGPRVPAAVSPKIETRSIKNESVFELAYVEEHWQLTTKPEKKSEQLWFEYAFD